MDNRKIVAITYSNKKYIKTAKLNIRTAKRNGRVDETIRYTPKDIDIGFWNENKKILEMVKGNGYWLWKPYFIDKTLKEMEQGDILIYVDAGSMYVDKVSKLIKAMDKSEVSRMIFSLENGKTERKYTKRDAFILLDCDSYEYSNTLQADASVIVLVNNDENRELCEEWLQYATDERILTDLENTQGMDNYSDYINHRYDQSVLSLLAKKFHSIFFRDPSQFGMQNTYPDDVIARSSYPQILNHHRYANVNSQIQVYLKQTELGKKFDYKLCLLRTRLKHG